MALKETHVKDHVEKNNWKRRHITNVPLLPCYQLQDLWTISAYSWGFYLCWKELFYNSRITWDIEIKLQPN